MGTPAVGARLGELVYLLAIRRNRRPAPLAREQRRPTGVVSYVVPELLEEEVYLGVRYRNVEWTVTIDPLDTLDRRQPTEWESV